MPYRTSPRVAERKAAMRARILAAARRLFADQGYAATTLQQVVAAAGTSIGNCYFYFPNKEALLLAVADELIAEVSQAIDAALARTPPGPAQPAVAIYVGATTMFAHAATARLTLVEAAHPALRPSALEHFTGRISRFFAAHPDLLGGADPVLAAHAWQGTLFNVLEATIAGKLAAPPEMVGRFLARWNLQALGLPPAVVDEALATMERVIHSG